MALVIDNSIAVSWILRDEDSPEARKALVEITRAGMIVPSIFWYEFRNTLVVSERRGRLSPDETEQALMVLAALDPVAFDDHSEIELMRLARAHGLSVYDAAYVELALRKGGGIATLDMKMAQAAAKEGVYVVS